MITGENHHVLLMFKINQRNESFILSTRRYKSTLFVNSHSGWLDWKEIKEISIPAYIDKRIKKHI
jgi:hypothetical protein